ncbi:hypothetical protein HG530_002731 [Fusarium avenaceum]|nr:hypothetical protein HG530_002731 [Fusarium avenaceum]
MGPAPSWLTFDRCDLAIVRGGWQARTGTLSCCRSNAGLFSLLILVATTSTTTTASKEATQETTELALLFLVVVVVVVVVATRWNVGEVILNTNGRGSAVVGRDIGSAIATAEEVGDHDRCIDRSITLSPAQGAGLSAANLAVTDDGGVSLRAASVA